MKNYQKIGLGIVLFTILAGLVSINTVKAGNGISKAERDKFDKLMGVGCVGTSDKQSINCHCESALYCKLSNGSYGNDKNKPVNFNYKTTSVGYFKAYSYFFRDYLGHTVSIKKGSDNKTYGRNGNYTAMGQSSNEVKAILHPRLTNVKKGMCQGTSGGWSAWSQGKFYQSLSCVNHGYTRQILFTGPYHPRAYSKVTSRYSNSYINGCGNTSGNSVGFPYNWCTIKMYVKQGAYKGRFKSKTKYKHITMTGELESKPDRTMKFYTPYIYVNNANNQDINLIINSNWNQYSNIEPDFNQKNGWNLKANNNQFVDAENNKTYDHLYYELGMKQISLVRQGQNFSSSVELFSFLNESNFFNKLGLTETQKQNAISSVKKDLPESQNYYLTILDSEAIADISELSISPVPEQVIRKYFAVYPTLLPVATNGDLSYPETEEITNKYTLLETGEIIVQPNIYVIWK